MDELKKKIVENSDLIAELTNIESKVLEHPDFIYAKEETVELTLDFSEWTDENYDRVFEKTQQKGCISLQEFIRQVLQKAVEEPEEATEEAVSL